MGVVGTVRSGQVSRPARVLAMVGRECTQWPPGMRTRAPVSAWILPRDQNAVFRAYRYGPEHTTWLRRERD